MKQFVKVALAAMCGSLMAFALFFIIGLSIVASISALSSKTEDLAMGPVRDQSVLRLPLDGTLKDRVYRKDIFAALFRSQEPPEIDLYELSQTLRKAKEDDKIKGLFLHVKSLRGGLANAEALRREILSFKESGKFVMAYAEVISEYAYLVVSAADEVALYPKGYFEWDGLFSTVSYFKGSLKKLEMVPQIFRVGKYKSAIEPFINDKMSPESREQMEEIIDQIWQRMRTVASEKTKISEEDLEEIADKVQVITAQQAFEKGFVDLLASYEEVENKLMELTGVKDKPHFAHWRGYHKHNIKTLTSSKKDKIAVVFADGAISTENGDGDEISSDKLAPLLNKIRKDKDIKAVVLRVNSPGGSALASDVIWTATQWLKEDKPLVTSFGNVAASGGYYMSAGSHYIFAEPTTITGSIGVFGLKVATQDFWNNKLGMTFDTVKSHRYSNLNAQVAELDPQERLIMQSMVDQIYDDFLQVVLKGRTQFKQRDEVHNVAQGRVWTGQRALELGLVDELGGLDQALTKVAELAELKDYQVELYPKEKSPMEQFLTQFGDVSANWLKAWMPKALWPMSQSLKEDKYENIYMRLPFDWDLK
jgi:protease IV